MQISIKKTSLVVAVMAMAAVGAYAALQRSEPMQAPAVAQAEDPNAVKVSIGQTFATTPDVFDLPAASNRLAKARLDGYAVCTQSDEATAAQYVDVSVMLDKAVKHVALFQRAVNGVMDSKSGMTDCDFRVISVIAQVSASG